MAERRIETNQRFNLLSSDLAEISRASTTWAQDQRAFKAWLAPVDLRIFETPYFDEVQAFKVAEVLLRRLNVFGHSLPVPALKLEDHYKDAKEGGDEYWRFALNAQKERVATATKGIPATNEAERQLRNVRRGIERAVAELDIFADKNNQLAMFGERLKSHKLRMKVSELSREVFDKIVDQFRKEVQEKIDKIYDKVLNLEEEEISLENKIVIRKFIDELVEITRAELLRVSGQGKAPTTPNANIPRESQDLDVGRKRRTFIPEPAKKDGPKTDGKKEFDNLQITKDKFIRAIELALQSGNKLRILIPPEGRLRARFEPQWRDVLEKMGFRGSIEFVVYEDLKRTTDTSTPIMTFKGMNTHGNLWDRARFNNVAVIDLAPLLILNQLQ
jgi:hypothetical protein